MDALLSRAQGILYELFALPTLRGARCVLVGAANTMNLTDRVLPRLRARDCEPELAAFPAYTVAQLGELLRARLATLPWRVFEDAALDLCARRVAAASGDMRRALPRHHLLTLCTAVLLFRGGDRKDATLGELNDAYTELCRRKSLKGLSAVDFSSVCSALADDALITCSDRRGEERKRRISLCVREEDVVFALQGTHLCAALLAE